MTTKQDKLAAIEILEKAIKNGRKTECGICFLLKPFIEKRELHKIMKTWPRHSGSYIFPVPSPIKGKSEVYMFYNGTSRVELWADDEYGDLRRDLARHIINELTKEIEND